MILLIDNYDSSTYNVVHALGKMDKDILVKKSDELTIEEIDQMKPDYIILSSGSGRPEKAGFVLDIIRSFAGKIPILGVGQGCHAIAFVYGANIVKSKRLLHGKPSNIYHDTKTIFSALEQPFKATRYHSLIVDRKDLPDCLQVTAWSDEDEVMGIRHNELPVEGVQFNPESIMTESGEQLLKNFIDNYRMAVN